MESAAVDTGVCPSCQGSEIGVLRRYRTNTAAGRKLFAGRDLARCGSCGLVWVTPMPDKGLVDAYYRTEYRKCVRYGVTASDVEQFPHDNLFYLNRGRSSVALLDRFIEAKPSRAMDIGAGFGHWLHALREEHPACVTVAVELSEPAVKHLRAIGQEVIDQPVESVLPRGDSRYDVVVLSHVLEHLVRPQDMLGIIRESLTGDGRFFVEVPHIPEEYYRTCLDHVWAPRYDEPHTYFFTAQSLRGVLERAGFRVLFCDSAGPSYRPIARWHYNLPPVRWMADELVPKPVIQWLRKQKATSGIRMQEREPSFYEYGGPRIWLRAVCARG